MAWHSTSGLDPTSPTWAADETTERPVEPPLA